MNLRSFFFVWRNFNFFCAHLFFLGAFSCLAGVMFAGVSARFARCAPLAAIMRHFRFIRAFKFFSLGRNFILERETNRCRARLARKFGKGAEKVFGELLCSWLKRFLAPCAPSAPHSRQLLSNKKSLSRMKTPRAKKNQ